MLTDDEEVLLRIQFWHPKPDDVVLDVGSCDGTYTIPALDAGASVYAVDARIETLRDLADEVDDRGWGEWLTTRWMAMYDGGEYPQELLEQIAESQFASSRGMVPDADCRWGKVDGLKLRRCDWLKVDVEGGELGVIRGARRLLLQCRPRVLIEDHSRIYPWVAEQDTTNGLIHALKRARYCTKIVPDTNVDYVVGIP